MVVAYSTYPATRGVLDWLAHRIDACDFSAFKYWFCQSKMVELVAQYEYGEISERSARRILHALNTRGGSDFSLEEIMGLDNQRVFSPAGDEVLFCDAVKDVIAATTETSPVAAIQQPDLPANWMIIYHPEQEMIVAVKTPYTSKRRETEDGLVDGLAQGETLAFVLPDEVVGIINQENEKW